MTRALVVALLWAASKNPVSLFLLGISLYMLYADIDEVVRVYHLGLMVVAFYSSKTIYTEAKLFHLLNYSHPPPTHSAEGP